MKKLLVVAIIAGGVFYALKVRESRQNERDLWLTATKATDV